ncbi:MAG: hypothetical protein BGO41_06730 [Clostridiales bacterium 38-18]|nr:MAG: hypothetical protein BGO41_06730 [Clostridiales bacterium 38-18]
MIEETKTVVVTLFVPEHSKYTDSITVLFNETIESLNPIFAIKNIKLVGKNEYSVGDYDTFEIKVGRGKKKQISALSTSDDFANIIFSKFQ